MIKLINAKAEVKILPPTISIPRMSLDLDTPTQNLQGRDGSVQTGKTTIRSRQFALEGSLYHPNKSEIESELDSLLAFLMQSPLRCCRTKNSERYLTIIPQGTPQDWLDRGAEIRIRIPVEAHDPYWYGDEVELTLSGTQTITVAGNAPTTPFVETTGNASNLTVVNATTGKQMVVTGVNGKIRVDGVNDKVTVDGVNQLDRINDEWLAYGFELLPGDNFISTNTEIKLTYRPRWF